MEPIRSHRGVPPAPVPSGGPQARGEEADSVYPPREDTFLLASFTEVPMGTRVLEVGTGSGFIALAAARWGARVVATDRNPHALRQLRRRARAEGLDVSVVRTDLARGLGRFDRVLANPPYLPTRPGERDSNRWHNLALDGGADGCRVTARLLGELPDHLLSQGEAFVVTSSLQDAKALEEVRRLWEGQGGSVEVAGTRDLEGERLSVWRLRLRPI